MNIYIYGSNDFKKEMNSLIDHSNLRLRMGEYDSIVELEGLEEIEEAILEHPDDIFLIDDKKIIKENALNKKLPFLKPKDGISQVFLEEHGIGNEMSFDSLKSLSKYLISRYEEREDEDLLENRDEIQETIMDIVDEAYSEEEEANEATLNAEEELSPELDDELNNLLSQIKKEKPDDSFVEEKGLVEEIDEPKDELDDLLGELTASKREQNDELDDLLKQDLQPEEENDDLDALLQALDQEDRSEEQQQAQDELDDLLSSIEEQESKTDQLLEEEQEVLSEEPEDGGTDFEALMSALDEPSNSESTNESSHNDEETQESLSEYDIPTIQPQESEEQGELMGDQLSLDEINENEMLMAFGAEAPAQSEVIEEIVAQRVENNQASDDKVSLNLTNPEELSLVLGELLKNKTLEITVKVKE